MCMARWTDVVLVRFSLREKQNVYPSKSPSELLLFEIGAKWSLRQSHQSFLEKKLVRVSMNHTTDF